MSVSIFPCVFVKSALYCAFISGVAGGVCTIFGAGVAGGVVYGVLFGLSACVFCCCVIWSYHGIADGFIGTSVFGIGILVLTPFPTCDTCTCGRDIFGAGGVVGIVGAGGVVGDVVPDVDCGMFSVGA